ncbi:hypothetical protein BU105_10870 [Staphylococcus xylosus]|uniref:hypothetical protein n=1 Tax=Staphylococcus xylosus TaxID=1288 RepID=UPI000D1D2918|nr:hypothetical protein [Staphylococcus xylosus]PTH97214.1 hypothetical protein BU105_10870 [Staphylococcus xylosus]
MPKKEMGNYTISYNEFFKDSLKIQLKQITEPINKLATFFKNIDINNPEAKPAFVYYNFPLHYELNIFLIHKIVDKYRERAPKEEVEQIIINSFEEFTFNEIKQNWKNSNLLQQKQLIFKNIDKAYSNELFSLIVPAITVHIEGIIKQTLHIDIISTNKLKKVITFLFPMSFYGDEIIRNYYIDIIISSENNDPNNRHAITHGTVSSYTKKIHSIKAILIFDAILSQLENLRSEDLNKLNKDHQPTY